MMMLDWPTETIERCLAPLSLGHLPKLQTKSYELHGKYPIIDQGQDLVAGWTDNLTGLISESLPLVVFGDHTRALKYIDFPFVRGADGTQILKPRAGIDPLYFYYACRAVELPSRGYNRHFAALKESEIGLPQEGEQIGIGNVLRLIEGNHDLQRKQLGTAQSLKTAAMRALFTRGLRGEAQKETEIGLVPDGWQLKQISAIGNIVTGNTPPTKDHINYDDGDIPFIAPGDIAHGSAIRETEKHISHVGLRQTRSIGQGATCFVCIGSTIGKVGFATVPTCATNQQINSVVPNDDFDPLYVFYLMTFWSPHIRKQASPSPVPILSKGAFEQIGIYCSIDKDEQKEIAVILDAIDHKIDLHRRKRAVLDALFTALLHKLMTGELRASQLDLSALSAVTSAEVAA